MTTSEDYEPVNVKVSNLAELGGAPKGYRAHYETFVLTANDPVECILPEDSDRVVAYVMAIDNDVVIGTKNQAASSANTVTSVPQPIGTYIPAKTTGGALAWLPVHDCNAVFAGATTTASNSRVTVAAYYRD